MINKNGKQTAVILGEPQGMIKNGLIQDFGYESGATSSKESRCTLHFHIQSLE